MGYLANYIRAKKHRLLLFWILSPLFILALGALEIVSFLPPQVFASSEGSKMELDQDFKFSLVGSFNKSNLKINIKPALDYDLEWVKSTNPIQQDLLIKPKGLAKENTFYKVSIQTTTWLGVVNNFSQIFHTSSLPKIVSSFPLEGAAQTPAEGKIQFLVDKTLSKGDFVFLSTPEFKNKKVWEGRKLTIVPSEKLKQGQTYQTSLFLKTDSKNLLVLKTLNFTTLSALTIASTEPLNKENFAPKNQVLRVVFNKEVETAALQNSWSLTPATEGVLNMLDKNTAQFTSKNLLKTNTNYRVKIASSLKASDNSFLDQDFVLDFKTAGPARVLSISPSSSSSPPNSVISVTFDQPVDSASAQSHFSVQPKLEGTFSFSGKSLIFRPSSLALLTKYTVTLSPGIKSIGGEDSKEVFSGSFTTNSEYSRTIGYSVNGRPITATYFGNGPKKIFLLASIHGSESNTGVMLSSWITYLRNNQGQIGSDRTFIVLPFANPDGKAANKRFNAHDVDLNRNWDANWQAMTYWQYNTYPHGGGSAPFSEPETKALRDFILAENPVRIISYHSAASTVIGDGFSQDFRNWYSNKTGYAVGAGGAETFGYSITGTLEEWAQNRGIVTIVVEFATVTSSEYDRNLPALKGLLTLPL